MAAELVCGHVQALFSPEGTWQCPYGFHGPANALRAFPRAMSMPLGFSQVVMSLVERERERERKKECVL